MSIRIYTEHALAVGADIELDKAASTHLIKVLRAPLGAHIELFNGDGRNYGARILDGGKRARLHIESADAGLAPSPLAITLVQGVSRGDRMDFSIQKATELGVHKIQPVFCEKNKVKLDGDRLQKKIQHWKSVAWSACEQCGRSDLPEILRPQNLELYLATPTSEYSVVLAFGEHPDLSAAVAHSNGALNLLVGAESGLSERELDTAIAMGWQPCQLGSRVLRTETATVTSLSILQYLSGGL